MYQSVSQSARHSAAPYHVIDDVISHDADDVINYVRPADTGKSIVTTDIRRGPTRWLAGWAVLPVCVAGDQRAVAAAAADVVVVVCLSSSYRSQSRRELARQVRHVT